MHRLLQEHDAYSGDYGLGFFGISLETGSTFVLHESLGALCYLCNFVPTTIHNNNTGTNASSFLPPSTVYTIVPRDAYKQRLFLEPLGKWKKAGFVCSYVNRWD